MLILAQNEKDKTTFFSQTLKVEENKVVLFFWFELKWARYWHFSFLKEIDWRGKCFETQYCSYLPQFSSKWENKTILFPSTLKVWQNKVVLFSHFKLNWGRYEQFYVSKPFPLQSIPFKNEKCQYPAHFSSNQKNKTTLFSSTFKVSYDTVIFFNILR